MVMLPEQGQGFTLDIGTRKVVGLITAPARSGLKILAAERREHQVRAMFDGQVHDVAAVAEVVGAIKERLEARTGRHLTEVAVAAAGRALRTARGRAHLERPTRAPISAEEALGLELEAVQDAQGVLAGGGEGPGHDYLFMGHSVIRRELDGQPLSTLAGQRGEAAAVEVVATFLPRGVVDSLVAVLDRVGLTMAALTLEPIAAIEAVIPVSMRHLALALVDVGAGTSDIAITRAGAVVAYDMVPVAGDEFTEAISHAFLLDWPVAEAAKRGLAADRPFTCANVVGAACAITPAEGVAALEPVLADWADQVGSRILDLTGATPEAVVLVGGGSQAPGAAGALARRLGLHAGRVAIRGREAIAGITGARALAGPEAVTPVGIALAVQRSAALGFAYVYVNGRGVRLFHPARLRVADALLAAGYRMRDLQPRLGRGITVSVNGSLRLVPGTSGQPAVIIRNGEPAGLKDPVQHRDEITVTPAQSGRAPAVRLKDLLSPEQTLRLRVDGHEYLVLPALRMNGAPADPEATVADNAQLEICPPTTLAGALRAIGLGKVLAEREVTFTCNGEPRSLSIPRYILAVDGRRVGPDWPLAEGLQVTLHEAPIPTVAEALTPGTGVGERPGERPVRVTVNGEVVELKRPPALLRNGKPAGADDPLEPGDRIELRAGRPGAQLLFAHALERAGFRTVPPAGKGRLTMAVNGRPAEFVTPLQDGDRIDIGWE